MADPVQGKKFNAFVKKSVNKASNALKFVPFDKKDSPGDGNEEDEASLKIKKEHRRAQVRKAQIEHRQRKENHIKTLEQEIADLRDMIAVAEHKSYIFRLENEDIKRTLKQQANNNPNDNHLAIPSSATHTQLHGLHTPISSTHSSAASPSLNCFKDQDIFDAIASVDFDALMNVSYLQLKNNNAPSSNDAVEDFGMLADLSLDSGTSTQVGVPENSNFMEPVFVPVKTEISTPPQNVNSFSLPNSTTSMTLKASPKGSVREKEYLDDEMDPSQEDPEVALTAINFILALEHPCRTHFLPKGPAIDGLPVLPSHVPSGHELMASTALYAHAPLPVYQTMHWSTQHHSPDSTPIPPSSIPWKVPSNPAEELRKLWDMSSSLSKYDWEITPVQAWFLLVDYLGTEALMREGVLEALKMKLALLVDCFGFGATLNEGLFWGVVREVEGMTR